MRVVPPRVWIGVFVTEGPLKWQRSLHSLQCVSWPLQITRLMWWFSCRAKTQSERDVVWREWKLVGHSLWNQPAVCTKSQVQTFNHKPQYTEPSTSHFILVFCIICSLEENLTLHCLEGEVFLKWTDYRLMASAFIPSTTIIHVFVL